MVPRTAAVPAVAPSQLGSVIQEGRTIALTPSNWSPFYHAQSSALSLSTAPSHRRSASGSSDSTSRLPRPAIVAANATRHFNPAVVNCGATIVQRGTLGLGVGLAPARAESSPVPNRNRPTLVAEPPNLGATETAIAPALCRRGPSGGLGPMLTPSDTKDPGGFAYLLSRDRTVVAVSAFGCRQQPFDLSARPARRLPRSHSLAAKPELPLGSSDRIHPPAARGRSPAPQAPPAPGTAPHGPTPEGLRLSLTLSPDFAWFFAIGKREMKRQSQTGACQTMQVPFRRVMDTGGATELAATLVALSLHIPDP